MRDSASALTTFSVSLVSGQVKATKSASGKTALKSRGCDHGVRGFVPFRGVTLDADHAHAESFGKIGQPAADTAETENQQNLAAEFILALAQIGNHSTPDMFGLIVARLWQAPCNGEDERHHMF